MNYKFYEITNKKKYKNTILELISNELNFVKNILNKFQKNYNLEFYKNNIFQYEIFLLNDIIQGQSLNFKISEDFIKKIKNYDFNIFVNNVNNKLNIRKKELEQIENIYSEEDIIKQLNPSNEICFNIMKN